MYACLKRRFTADTKKNLLSPTNDTICFSISTLSKRSVADSFVSVDDSGCESFSSTPADNGGSGDVPSRGLRILVLMSCVAPLLSFVHDANATNDEFASGGGGGEQDMIPFPMRL